MKKNILKKTMIGFAVGASAMMAPCSVSAVASSAADECAKELLLSYFPEPVVLEMLKRFSVPQEKWAGIAKSLSGKDKDVVKLVEDKAALLNPNPLKDPQQRQAAVKLFRETLLQVFTDALKENGITDTSKFQAMLDDIQQQKAKKFAMCMEKQKNQALQKDANGQASDTNDGDDDEDDMDDGNEDSDDDTEDQSQTQKTK